jgi:hypothetical protein
MAIYISDSNGILKKVAGAGGGSSGESIIVDSVLNSESANPVQNKALYNPVTFAETERKKSKNILNLGNKTETINGVTVEVANSKITMSGAPSNIGDIFIDIPEMTLKANKTYIYSMVVLNGKSKGSTPIPYTTSSIIIPNQAFTLTSDLVLNRLQIYMLNTQNQDVTFGVQIEEGSAITDWEDFSGKILHEIDLNEYYNKSEVDKLIDDIPETDLSNYYNKGEVDNKIDNIPETDLSEYYTKSETVSEIVNNINVKFAESERQKSKNLFNINDYSVKSGYVVFPYTLQEGKEYTFSSNNPITQFKISDYRYGNYFAQKENAGGFTSFTFTPTRPSGMSEDETVYIFISIVENFTPITSISDLNGYEIQIEEGTVATEYQQYNGAIVHENIIQGMAGVVLWSNPSQKTSFPSQTITLSSGISAFDYLMLEYEAYVPANDTYNCLQYSYFKPIINGSAEFLSGGWDSGTRYIKARSLKVVSETQIEFADGYQEDVKNDRMVVPMRILGIKKGV